MNSELENNETTVDALLHAQPEVDTTLADVVSTPAVKQKVPSKELPVLSKAERDDFRKLALQQNLWVNFGSGRSPSV